jgi:hypothetical protein
MDVIIVELSDIHGAISPFESARTVFLPVLVITFVFRTIWPGLNTESVLFVFAPFPGILSAIHVHVGSSAVSLVIEPLTLVYIAIRVNESAPAVGHVILPVALILTSVLPDLNATAMSETFFRPLTLIDGSVIKLIRLSLNQL